MSTTTSITLGRHGIIAPPLTTASPPGRTTYQPNGFAGKGSQSGPVTAIPGSSPTTNSQNAIPNTHVGGTSSPSPSQPWWQKFREWTIVTKSIVVTVTAATLIMGFLSLYSSMWSNAKDYLDDCHSMNETYGFVSAACAIDRDLTLERPLGFGLFASKPGANRTVSIRGESSEVLSRDIHGHRVFSTVIFLTTVCLLVAAFSLLAIRHLRAHHKCESARGDIPDYHRSLVDSPVQDQAVGSSTAQVREFSSAVRRRNPWKSSSNAAERVPTSVPMLIRIPGDKNGLTAKAALGLLDTGSELSFAFERRLTELGWKDWVDVRNTRQLITKSGATCSSRGTINLKWSIRGANKVYLTEFHVLRDHGISHFEFHLGLDWIKSSRAIVFNTDVVPEPGAILEIVEDARLARQALCSSASRLSDLSGTDTAEPGAFL